MRKPNTVFEEKNLGKSKSYQKDFVFQVGFFLKCNKVIELLILKYLFCPLIKFGKVWNRPTLVLMHAALLTMRALGRGYFVHALLVFFLLQFMKCDTLYESAPRRFLPVLKSWVKNCSLGKWRQIFCWWFGPLGSATLAVRNISRQAIYTIQYRVGQFFRIWNYSVW